MRFAHAAYAQNMGSLQIIREVARSKIAEFWRRLSRPVTFFDEPSPRNCAAEEIARMSR